MFKLRRFLLAVSFGVMGFQIGVAGALAQSAGPSLVVDAATGAVLSENNASQAWHPASTTKMMTAYVALRAVRAGRIGLQTPIPASPLAARQPRVKVYIKPGQEITLDNALKVMMVKSANDISYVIAEGVGGTVENFVTMMNAEAQRLGLRDTVFRNPNGWHHPEQQTSARDLAVLTLTMLREFPEYEDYWGIGAVQLGRVTLNNTNGLIGRYAGASGFKTGFVCASGFNLVATAERGGRTLIAVVLGAYSGIERTVTAAQLLDAGFASWGGTGRNIMTMGPSGTTARSICAEVRAFGRGAPLSDDSDFAGPIAFAPNATIAESNDKYAGLGVQMHGGAAPRAAGAGGRLTLGPRASFTPIQIAYGRTAGSANAPLAANVARRAPATAVAASQPAAVSPTAAAARPGAIPMTAGAVAAGAIAAGAVAVGAAAFASPSPAEGPIRLHGAIAGSTAAPLRPSAAAGIRPPARPQAGPQTAATTATQRVVPAATPARAGAAARPAPRASTAASRAKPQAKPKPKPKPVVRYPGA